MDSLFGLLARHMSASLDGSQKFLDKGQTGYRQGTRGPRKEVKLGSSEVRFLIAKCSPNEIKDVGLPIAAAEKKLGLVRATATVVRSPQSGLTSRNREKWAKFASLAEARARFSLQYRLHGGEKDIRTFGTGR